MISTIYDPLGILTPALLKPKKIIQHLWKNKIDWCQTIPHQLLAQWNAWKQDLENITKILLNRWFGFHKEKHRIKPLSSICYLQQSVIFHSRQFANHRIV